MARVQVKSEAWGYVVDTHGHPKAGKLCAIDTIVYAAATGSLEIAPAAWLSDAEGYLPGFVVAGTYAFTDSDGDDQQVDAPSGAGGPAGPAGPAGGEVPPGWFCVTSPPYSATGDGATDDATAISDAIDDAAVSGGVVYFPPGVYAYSNLTSLLTLDNVALVGAGMGTSRLRPLTNNARFLYIEGSDITLKDLSIGPSSQAGADSANANLEFLSASRVRVENVEVFNASSLSLAFNDCSDVSCYDNYVHDSRRDGIHCVNCDGHLKVRGNHVTDCADDGIAVWCYTSGEAGAMYGAYVENNTVEDMDPGKGIQIGGSVGVMVKGNHTKNTVSPGIRVGKEAIVTTEGCKRVAVIGNVVHTPNATLAGGYAGIEVSEWNSSGVRVYNGVNEDVIVADNQVYLPGNSGIEVSSTERALVHDNLIVDSNNNNGAYTTALDCSNATHLNVHDNIIVETRGSPQVTFPISFSDTSYVDCHDNNYKGMTNESVALLGTNVDLRLNGWCREVVASTAALPIGEHSTFITVTDTTNITSMLPSAAGSYPGREITLHFEGVLTVTDGSNLKLAGNFVTTAGDTLTLVCDGSTYPFDWWEKSRSAN